MKVQLFLLSFCTTIVLAYCNPNCPVDTIYSQHEDECISKSLIFPDEVNIEEICVGVFFSARVYPEGNEYYIGCIRGIPMILKCYENEIFDANLLECIVVNPETTPVSGTTTSTETPTNPDTTTRTETPTQPDTTTRTEMLTEPETTTRTETPTQPDTTTRTETSTEPEITRTETPTTTIPKNPCEGITSGRIPHPDDCTLCQLCFMYQILAVECKCMQGQIFWINECVNGNPETCQPSS